MPITIYTRSPNGGIDALRADGCPDLSVTNGNHGITGLRRMLSGDNTPETTFYTVIQTSASRDIDNLLKTSGLESRGYFSTGLLDALHKRLSDILGSKYYSFPMVDMGHFLDQNPFYPHTHILGGFSAREEEFREAVNALLTGESIDIMIGREQPQNYQTPPLEFLKTSTLSAPPLVIDPRVSIFTGTQMVAIANTLMPYSVKRQSSGGNYD